MAKKKGLTEGELPSKSPSQPRDLQSRITGAANILRVQRSEIKEALYNPRQLSASSFKRLCDSIRKFGLVDPPIVNKRTGNTLVGGHQRVKAMDKIFGYPEDTPNYEIPIAFIDVDLNTEKALNVALNNPAIQGQFDVDLLQEIVLDLRNEDYDIHATGFTTTDMHQMFDDEFLDGIFARQRDDEKPEIDLLNEIRGVSKEEEKLQAQAQAQGQPQQPQQPDGSPDSLVASPADDGGNDDFFGPIDSGQAIGEKEDSSETSGHPPASNTQAGDHPGVVRLPDGTLDPKSVYDSVDNKNRTYQMLTEEEKEAYRKHMHFLRGGYRSDKTETDDAADVIYTVVFDNSSQLHAFINRFGLDGGNRYIDYSEFVRVLDEHYGSGEPGID